MTAELQPEDHAKSAILYAGAKHALGDEEADILMERIPPSNWQNFATKDDVEKASLSVHNRAVVHASDAACRRRFDTLLEAWKEETLLVSSVTEKWRHPAYQSIIEMGDPAVPLILERIRDGERFWTRALLSITGENPAISTRTPEEAQRAWLEWGEARDW